MKSNIEQLKLAEKDLGESCRKCCSMANNCCCYFVSKSFQNADNGKLFYDGVTVTYCPNAIKWCKTHMAQIPLYLAMPSDVIFFDWNGNKVPDHIALVRKHKSCDAIYTLEGNTTEQGIVAYQTRPAKYVLAIYRPHFKGKYDISKPIEVDGVYGYSSIALTQKWLGVTVDGILGRGTVKALQKKLKVEADGIWGVGTSKALQKLIGVEADGLFGENSVKALQRYLNKQMFKTTSTPVTKPVTKPQTPVTPSVPTTTPKADKYKVIDVSVWQGTIDWAKVKADGVVGAIIRYADGSTLDSKFDYNMKQAKANGIHIGAYIFSRAKTKAEAEKEASRLYSACKPYAPDLPLYIDLEDSKLAKYADTVAIAFLNKMKALGGKGGVYANLNWWNKYLTKTAKDYSASPFWIAQYNSRITHKNPDLFGMWQYSSSGSVKGISGKVDMDWLYNAYWEDAPKAPEPLPTPVPTPTVKPVEKPKEKSWQDKACDWVKKIADDNLFHYVRFKSNDPQTHKCPICSGIYDIYENLKKGVYKVGSEGTEVKWIQKFLKWNGSKLTVDGIYGSGTATAVRAFQKNNGLKVDGIWGDESRKKAKSILKKYLGGNCIWFAYAALHHGGGLPTKCSCGVIDNAGYNKLLKVSQKKANELASKWLGGKAEVIRNGGKPIPISLLKKADVLVLYHGDKYYHTAFDMGGDKYAESNTTGGIGDARNIRANLTMSATFKANLKLAIRYIGD